MRGGGPFATPRTPLSTTRVRDLPWNNPPIPKEPEPSVIDDMFKGISSWWGDTFGGEAKKKKKKKKKAPPKEDDRPAWNSATNTYPLTGPSGPPAVAFHRKPLRPWEEVQEHEEFLEPQQLPRPAKWNDAAKDPKAKAPKGSIATKSPSGRTHPSRQRRTEVREAELMNSISYFDGAYASSGSKLLTGKSSDKESDQLGGYITADSTRYMASSGWIPGQAWAEALRFYPSKEVANSFGDSHIALSGNSHTASKIPSEHLEADVRKRAGVASADPAWRNEQLHLTWAPNMIPSHLKRKLAGTVDRLLTAVAPPSPRPTTTRRPLEVRL